MPDSVLVGHFLLEGRQLKVYLYTLVSPWHATTHRECIVMDTGEIQLHVLLATVLRVLIALLVKAGMKSKWCTKTALVYFLKNERNMIVITVCLAPGNCVPVGTSTELPSDGGCTPGESGWSNDNAPDLTFEPASEFYFGTPDMYQGKLRQCSSSCSSSSAVFISQDNLVFL